MEYLVSAYVIILMAIASYALVLIKRQQENERDLELFQQAEGTLKFQEIEVQD